MNQGKFIENNLVEAQLLEGNLWRKKFIEAAINGMVIYRGVM